VSGRKSQPPTYETWTQVERQHDGYTAMKVCSHSCCSGKINGKAGKVRRLNVSFRFFPLLSLSRSFTSLTLFLLHTSETQLKISRERRKGRLYFASSSSSSSPFSDAKNMPDASVYMSSLMRRRSSRLSIGSLNIDKKEISSKSSTDFLLSPFFASSPSCSNREEEECKEENAIKVKKNCMSVSANTYGWGGGAVGR